MESIVLGSMIFRAFNPKYFQERLFKTLSFSKEPHQELKLIVCIPAYKEPNVLDAIKSLLSNTLDPNEYEIHVLINYPETADEQLKKSSHSSFEKIQQEQVQKFIEPLPKKHAGVGLARKILMDNAAHRFSNLNKPEGILLAYDGDCGCSNNHLFHVLNYFNTNPNIEAASIHFEHPFGEWDAEHQEQIIDYELHLRSYINWQKEIGLPYAYQTIGSSMAVRAGAYTAEGGMNKRKAGEDFYFLHKFTGKGRFGKIKSTTVFPSARLSDRVPFGTGRAILEAQEFNKELNTYNPQSFIIFERLLLQLPAIYEGKEIELSELNQSLVQYLKMTDFNAIISECRNNSSSWESFEKRFYHRIDAFQFMKYLHYMRDNGFPNVASCDGANALLERKVLERQEDKLNCLLTWRQMDKA